VFEKDDNALLVLWRRAPRVAAHQGRVARDLVK